MSENCYFLAVEVIWRAFAAIISFFAWRASFALLHHVDDVPVFGDQGPAEPEHA
jgi:hypothetical protein